MKANRIDSQSTQVKEDSKFAAIFESKASFPDQPIQAAFRETLEQVTYAITPVIV